MVISATRSPFRRLFVDALLPAVLLMSSGCGGGDQAASTDAAATPGAGAPASPDGDSAAMGAAGMSSAPAMDSSGNMSGGSMPGAMASGGAGMSGNMAPAGGAYAPPSIGGDSSGASYPGAAPGMMAGGQYPGGPGGGQPQLPSRPDNVASWSDSQLVDAVHERDPRVLEAIDSRVKAAPGDPKVAQMLTSLLTALATPRPTSTPGMQGGAAGYAGASGETYPPNYPGGAPSSADAAASGAYAGSTSAPAGSSIQGYTPPGGTGNMAPQSIGPAGAPASPGATAPTLPATPPSQGAVRPKKQTLLAVDSISLMFLESATAFQGAAVGAMSSKNIPGAVGLGGSSDSSAAGAAQGSSPYSIPAGTQPGGAMQSPAMAPGNYSNPGAANGYAGGEYPAASGGMPAATGAGTGGLSEAVLIERIVDGLIRNGSPAAWQTIYGIAAQSVKTPLPSGIGAEIVTHALFRNIDSNPTMIEPILLSVIDGSAQLPPESRSAALSVMAQVAGLATDKMTGFTGTSAATAGAAGQFGAAGMSMPGGMSNPAMNAMSSFSTGGGRRSGDEDMAAYPAEPGAQGAQGYTAMASGMAAAAGLPGGVAGAAKPQLSDAALTRASSFLWGPKCVDALVKQLETASDIGVYPGVVGGGDFVRIAGAVPNDRVRKAVAGLFERTAPATVGQLGLTGFFSTSVHDPGMLISLKSLPRTKPSRTEAAQGVPLDPWATASLDVVLSLRDRMRALSTTPGKLTPVTDNMPIRLHKNAVAEFYGVLTLPGPAGAAMNESAPAATKIYYARTSFTPQKQKDQQELAEHYESRATGIKRVSEAKGVLLWVDGYKATQTGAKRTADVLVTSGNGAAGAAASGYGDSAVAGAPGIPSGYGGAAAGGAGGTYTIEIIVVETADAKAPAAADAKNAAAASK